MAALNHTVVGGEEGVVVARLRVGDHAALTHARKLRAAPWLPSAPRWMASASGYTAALFTPTATTPNSRHQKLYSGTTVYGDTLCIATARTVPLHKSGVPTCMVMTGKTGAQTTNSDGRRKQPLCKHPIAMAQQA